MQLIVNNNIRLAVIPLNGPEYQQSLRLREEILRKPLGYYSTLPTNTTPRSLSIPRILYQTRLWNPFY